MTSDNLASFQRLSKNTGWNNTLGYLLVFMVKSWSILLGEASSSVNQQQSWWFINFPTLGMSPKMQVPLKYWPLSLTKTSLLLVMHWFGLTIKCGALPPPNADKSILCTLIPFFKKNKEWPKTRSTATKVYFTLKNKTIFKNFYVRMLCHSGDVAKLQKSVI